MAGDLMVGPSPVPTLTCGHDYELMHFEMPDIFGHEKRRMPILANSAGFVCPRLTSHFPNAAK
jgi:hypothetical protein